MSSRICSLVAAGLWIGVGLSAKLLTIKTPGWQVA